MNITTNYPNVSLVTTNPATDRVARDNAVRPVVPPVTQPNSAGAELAHFLARRIYKLIDQKVIVMPQAIQPVPLHWRRQAKRGFNQAQLIANELSHGVIIPVVRDR